MKTLKFYHIFIFFIISFSTQAQDYSFVINKMYSGDNSLRKTILKEAIEEHGKTSLIIEYKNNAKKTESLIKEAEVRFAKMKSDFTQNSTKPDNNTYCAKAKKSTNKLNSLNTQIGQVGTMVSLAKTNYGMCANNAYRTTNCQKELSNLRSYENRYSALVSEHNQKLKLHKYNVEKCERAWDDYDTNVKEYYRKQEAIGNNYKVKINSLDARQMVIANELKMIMDKRPYLSETQHPNGNLRTTGTRIFGNSKAIGLWKIYYESGQLQAIGVYKNGKQSGEWKYYDENGKLSGTENYIEGELQE